MGTVCCYFNKGTISIPEIKFGEHVEDINNINDKSLNISNNNITIFNLNSRFNHKKIFNEEERNIKNKNTNKNINRRINLINRYKFNEDKLDKFIKFTHLNKIISTTTNSFVKQ